MSDETVPVSHTGTALRIDHVLLAVENLDNAAGVLADRYGLTSIEGGTHSEWGTANRSESGKFVKHSCGRQGSAVVVTVQLSPERWPPLESGFSPAWWW